MRRIKELLDLQLLAVPYSSIHEEETHFWVERSDDLLKFIQAVARGHRFESCYRVERTQILKAFQAYLANAPASYVREERDALPPRVHDWDGRFSVSVSRAVSGIEVERRRGFKQQALDELVKTLSEWAVSRNTFEQDMELEFRDSARILTENYVKRAAWISAGDFSALLDSPIDAEIVEDMLYILRLKGSAEPATVVRFFQSEYFAAVPSQQLSARLFSAFKKRVREGAYPNPQKALGKLSGFLFDVRHAATYVPYCDAFFTDRFMADLLFQRDGRSKEQVYVFRHDDKGMQLEGSLSPVAIHCLQKEFCMALDDEESFALPSRKGYEISASRGKRASRFHGGPQRLEAAFSLAYSGTTGSRALPEPKN